MVRSTRRLFGEFVQRVRQKPPVDPGKRLLDLRLQQLGILANSDRQGEHPVPLPIDGSDGLVCGGVGMITHKNPSFEHRVRQSYRRRERSCCIYRWDHVQGNLTDKDKEIMKSCRHEIRGEM